MYKKEGFTCRVVVLLIPIAFLTFSLPSQSQFGKVLLAGPSMTASKENQFAPSFSGLQDQNFSLNPTMMRSQEQTIMNMFNNYQVSFIICHSKRALEISKRQPSSCKIRAFIIEDDPDWTFTFADYCKACFLYINVKRLKGVKSILTRFQVLIWMILKVSVF